MIIQKYERSVMAETTLKIAGMRCHHCVMGVRKALSKLDGVTEAEVDVGVAKVSYEEDQVSEAEIENLVDRLGYSVQK